VPSQQDDLVQSAPFDLFAELGDPGPTRPGSGGPSRGFRWVVLAVVVLLVGVAVVVLPGIGNRVRDSGVWPFSNSVLRVTAGLRAIPGVTAVSERLLCSFRREHVVKHGDHTFGGRDLGDAGHRAGLDPVHG
jgi:hypothetical protein